MSCHRYIWDHTLERESVSEVLTGKEWIDYCEDAQVLQGQREHVCRTKMLLVLELRTRTAVEIDVSVQRNCLG